MTNDANTRNDATEPESYRLGLDTALKEAIQAFVDMRFVPEDELEALSEEAPAEESYCGYSAPMFARNMLSAPVPEAPEAAAREPRAAAPMSQTATAPARKRRGGGVIGSLGGALSDLARKGKHARKAVESHEEEIASAGAAPSASAASAPSASAGSVSSASEAEPCYDVQTFYGSDAYGIGLREWLDEVDAPFSTTLLRLIDERGYDDVDVYKRAGMSRQLFSRIRSDADYRPAKKTVLALAVALRLNAEEARDLLERAGFALSRSDKRDLVVEYFLENGKHDLMAVNQALYEFDQPLL